MTRLIKTSRNALFALGLVLMAPLAAFAQDAEMPAVTPAVMVVSTTDGATSATYQVTDISFYVSTIAAIEDQAAYTDFSLSLSGTSPLDTALMQWASQANSDADALRDLSITVNVADADGTEREMHYEISDAKITSVSTSHSSYALSANLSLQIAAGKLSIDGIAMN